MCVTCLGSRLHTHTLQQEPPFSNASMRCRMFIQALVSPTPTDLVCVAVGGVARVNYNTYACVGNRHEEAL
jgi:hypothetical protein